MRLSTESYAITRTTVTKLSVVMCALGALFYFYEYYLRVAPSVMSLELKQDFLLSDAAFGYLAACYYYAYTPMQIPVGMMMDRYGPRKILTFACFVCAIATYFFAITTQIAVAEISRFLIGFGSAFAYVGVLKIANVWLPSHYFALMVGMCSALGMLGGISGEVTIAYLMNHLGWRDTLVYTAWVGGILTLILWFFLRDKKETKGIEKRTGISASENTRRDTWMGLLETMSSRQMWLGGLVGCIMFLPISVFAEVWAVRYLESIGLTKHAAALGSSLVFLGFAIGGPIWGVIANVLKSHRKTLFLGSIGTAIVMGCVIGVPTFFSVPVLYGLLFLVGLFAAAEILVFAFGNNLSRPAVCATAAAFMNTIIMLGGFLAPVIGHILDSSLTISETTGLPLLTTQAYTKALMAIPVFLLVAGILSLRLVETHKHLR